LGKHNFLSVAVTALVVPALFATIALPAYAYSDGKGTPEEQASQRIEHLKVVDAQHVDVATEVAATSVDRSAFSATSKAQLRRAQLAALYAAYTGPSAADYLANPPYPNFDLNQVVAVAMKYQGVPYRYGGANPAGFDCSGFTAFVYSQFGIALPHSAAGQGRLGTPIALADALPGDLVIVSGGSHVGIYLGGGRMIDAPEAGGVVSAREIYTSNYYVVRVGI
jgi:peptidoglycan DL-endopeptidase CwlO